MSRLRLLTVLLLAALALALAGCGADDSGRAPNVDATLLLDFQPNAVHTGIYTAVARGYDTALGVTLRVRVPGDSTDAVKLLVAGTADLAVLDIHDLALARERGRDLVGVMALVQTPLAAILASPQIRSPGERAGAAGAPALYPELVITVTRETLRDRPSVVRASLAAISRGYSEVIKDPESGVSALVAAAPGARRERVQRDLNALSPSFTVGAPTFGALPRARVQAWARWARRVGLLRRDLALARAFDDRYVPPTSE